MNQKTRTALYSLAICACVISAATAVILTINAHNQNQKTEVASANMDKPEEEDQPKQDRPRRRQRRGGGGGGFRDGRRGDMTRLLPDANDYGIPTPEEFEEEVIKGLEEYRSMPPHERANVDRQMYQTTLFVRTGLDMMRENIHEIPPEELDRIRDDFDKFADLADQTFFSGIVEQYLTPEEDATIGEFVRTMHDAQDEFRYLLHNG